MRKTIVFGLIIALTVSTNFFSQSQANPTSDQSKLVLIKTISGNISPKSVRSSGSGLVSAHNMMYRHSVTLYDSNTQELIKTIPDSVRLSEFGFTNYSGLYRGSPVEGSFSPDGKHLYVTNYAMYGKGFNKEGHDICSPANGYDNSFVYRINLTNFKIDGVYAVGSVPKVIEVTPDNKYVLVTNWCSYTLDIISKKKRDDSNLIAEAKFLKNTKNNLWYEAGFGFDLYFEFFKMSPEIKFSQTRRSVLLDFDRLENPYVAPIDKLFIRNIQFSLFFE